MITLNDLIPYENCGNVMLKKLGCKVTNRFCMQCMEKRTVTLIGMK